MVDKAAMGSVGAPFTMDIERGKIHELARAVHASDPAYFTGDHPVVPPTFLTTMFFWEELVPGSNPWALVKMDQKRGLHAEQEYVLYGPPPRAGDRLFCQSRIAEIYEKEGRRGGTLTFAVMITEFRDASGRLVAEARLTGVETARPPEEGSGK
jgi:hypothetical protein